MRWAKGADTSAPPRLALSGSEYSSFLLVGCSPNELICVCQTVARQSGIVRLLPPRGLPDERPHSFLYLVADSSKCGQSHFFAALDSRGVLKAPVETCGGAWKHGTGVARIVTDGYYVVERLSCEFVQGLGPVSRDVDANLLHNRDCLRPHGTGFGSSAENIEVVTDLRAKQSFTHLAPCRVTGAQHEDSLHPISFLHPELPFVVRSSIPAPRSARRPMGWQAAACSSNQAR